MLNRLIIYEYINRLRYKDIINFAISQGVNLSNQEVDIIYNYIKNDYKKIFNKPEEVLNDAKNMLSNNTYLKLEELYIKYKDKIDSF